MRQLVQQRIKNPRDDLISKLQAGQRDKSGDAEPPARRELLSNCVTNVEPSSYPTKASSYPTKATKRQPKGTNKVGGLAYPELLDAPLS